MSRRTSQDNKIDLRAVTVRPTYGEQERRHWDHLVRLHHYLPFHRVFGKGLRHVAEVGSRWVALIGWQAGAFKLAARDGWIGWSAEQQFGRLHLIANNVRFVILTRQRVANLASRVLGLSLRRLSSDMQTAHGYPVFLAETFVDISRFNGTCYRAANWQSFGLTRGFARESGGSARWRYHGQPKEVFMFNLVDNAKEVLSQEELPPEWTGGVRKEPMTAPQLRSLKDVLGKVPEFRKSQGRRYPLVTVLVLAVAARLAGYRGVSAIAQFARLLSQEQLKAVGAFYSPSKKCYTAPVIATFHNIFAKLPPDTLDKALNLWEARKTSPAAPVAMDGKMIRGAAKQTEGGIRMMVAALEHNTGVVLGQLAIKEKSSEMLVVRDLANKLDIAGRTVTLDALHAQQDTARCLLENGADYVMTAIKDNQRTISKEIKGLDFDAVPGWTTEDYKHGRIEERTCWVVDLSGSEWDGHVGMHGRRQAIRIVRKRTEKKTGKTSCETVYALTSLGPEQAGARELLALVRNHWHIENRLHYVRDFTYDEDRCRVSKGYLPENLSCLSNVAIAIVRCEGRFNYLPEANRHYAARPQEAIELIMKPLN